MGQPQAQGLHGRSCGPCPTNGRPRILPGGMQIRYVCDYGNMTYEAYGAGRLAWTKYLEQRTRRKRQVQLQTRWLLWLFVADPK